mgnify:CR=1 FL=1
MKMEKKNLDWGNLGFGYMTTDYRYVANYKDGKWDDGALVTDPTVTLNECAGVFQYSQSCFEGLKAYTTEDGHIVCFRPDLNAVRMMDSAKRLEMPPFPAERFLEAVEEVVKANAAWVDEMTVVPLLVRFQFHSRLGCRGKAILQYLAIYRNRNVRPTGR